MELHQLDHPFWYFVDKRRIRYEEGDIFAEKGGLARRDCVLVTQLHIIIAV